MPRHRAIALVLGTRPEAIKLAPVVAALRRARMHSIIISTGQQRDLVRLAFDDFRLEPDYDLDLMRHGQSLAELTGRCVPAVARVLARVQPRLVLVQGDTSSALAGAMASFFEHIPVAHVEAGLRTGDLDAPFPEEANRQLVSRLAAIHFAPTLDAKANLLAESIHPARIEVTGNTIVDAVRMLDNSVRATVPPVRSGPNQKLVLVTAHRRENQGRPLERVCRAIARLAAEHADLHFAVVTHPNPAAGAPLRERLSDLSNVTLLEPLPYLHMLRLVSDSWLVLTDSGGLQEEAPSFGRPVLVLRDRSERTEGLALGAARLVGTRVRRIVAEVESLLGSSTAYDRAVPLHNPYGDGRAASRIVAAIRRWLSDRGQLHHRRARHTPCAVPT